MKPQLRAIFRKVMAGGVLNNSDAALLKSEIDGAMALLSSIAMHIPEKCQKDLAPGNWPDAYPKVLEAFMPVSNCKHDFAPLGPVATDRDTLSDRLCFSILKQCKVCKEIILEPADF